MSIEWVTLEKRYEELTQKLLAANLDRNKRQEWQREASHLSNLLERHKKVEKHLWRRHNLSSSKLKIKR